MSKSKLLQFQLAGVVGFGFLIEHAGIDQYSVAWPGREAERFSVSEAECRGVEISEVVLDATLEETDSDNEAIAELHKHYEQSIQGTIEGLQKEFAATLSSRDERIKILESELAKFNTPQTTPEAEDVAIEAYLKEHGLEVTNKSVMEVLKTHDIIVQSAQVTAVKERLKAAK